MSRWINTDQAFLPWVAQALSLVPTQSAVIVAEFDGVAPVAAVIFDGYNGVAVHVHIWVYEGRRPSRAFWFAVYHYCWQQLGCRMAIGTVPSSNKKALKLNAHLGFRPHTVIEHYYPNGDDMHMLIATPYTIPDWRKWQPVEFKIAA